MLWLHASFNWGTPPEESQLSCGSTILLEDEFVFTVVLKGMSYYEQSSRPRTPREHAIR